MTRAHKKINRLTRGGLLPLLLACLIRAGMDPILEAEPRQNLCYVDAGFGELSLPRKMIKHMLGACLVFIMRGH
jgi:hypothetical protein